MTTCIYWHRNDLRVHDNECLKQCVEDYDQVIPLFIVDENHYREMPQGFKKIGVTRYRYLCDTISVLRESYKNMGGQLVIRKGDAATEVKKIINQYDVTAIIYQKEIASEEVNDENDIREVAVDLGCVTKSVWGRTLYHLDDIPYTTDKIPLTSKAFRINTSKATEPRKLIPTPSRVNIPQDLEVGFMPSEKEMGYSDEEIIYSKRTHYPAGEKAALERLEYYTFKSQLVTSYKWTRNKSLGMDYSSKLSPYLALGSLSPRMIYHQVKKYEKEVKRNISTWWLIFEIVWRDFFAFKTLRVGSALFNNGGIRNKDTEWNYDMRLFKRWRDGDTGIPFLDAHLKELAATGFMSNRGRVNAASFFTRDYKIDWRWGASWFEHCLIDYDVYANWMNWHTQAFDIYYTNPVNQAVKYDKKGEYTLKWLPELSSLPHSDFHAPWLYTVGELNNLGIIDYRAPEQIYSKWQRAINRIMAERK